MCHTSTPAQDFLSEVRQRSYGTILADPPWQFSNRTGKMAPEHRRLSRYPTLTLQAIKAIPVVTVAATQSHLYLWVPNALLREGLEVVDLSSTNGTFVNDKRVKTATLAAGDRLRVGRVELKIERVKARA